MSFIEILVIGVGIIITVIAGTVVIIVVMVKVVLPALSTFLKDNDW